ncbi:MAG: MATE family efflux transporter [Sneathiellaceae bacterium]
MSRVADCPAAPQAPPQTSAWRREIRATLALAWPMVMTNLGQNAMTATDIIMMGRLGPVTLGAGTLGWSLYFAPMIFGLGLILATAPMIASELGRRRHSVRDVRRTVRQGLWIATLVAVPIWVFLWFAEPLLLLMGQQKELASEAGRYMVWLQWAILPFFWYIVLRCFMAALERPGWALAVTFFAVAFNVLANWCLMFGNLGFPAMGIAGSGLATTLSSLLMFAGVSLVVTIDKQFRRYRLFGRFWRPDWPRFLTLARLGLPIGAIVLFEVSIFNVAAMLMGLIGTTALAAHAIAMQVASLSFMVPMGISQAVTVRVGRAYGAGDPNGVARAGWTSFTLGVGFMALMALVMITVPDLLIGVFIDASTPESRAVAQLAVGFLAFAALFQIFDGAQAVAGGMLRGLHDTRVPMIYAAFGYWGVGLPVGALLAFRFGFGGAGIWVGLSSGLAVVGVLLLARWLARERLGLIGPR